MMAPMTGGARAWAGGVLAAAIACCPAAYAQDGGIRFSIGEGRVTLVARDALLGDVLAEWRRAGDTRFVDAGELDEAPVSLHLVDVPEAEALRLLLRPAAGYLAVPRAATTPGASAYDRVKILAVRSRSPMRASVAAPRAGAAAGGGASGAGRPADDGGDRAQPPELTEEAQIDRLQRLLHPRGSGDGSADTATETRPGARVPLTTPRPGMIVDPERPPTADEPRRRYRGSAREYDPFTVFPQGDER